MKILYTFRSLAVLGGIERVLVEKMNNLVTIYGYDVYILTTGQGDHPVPYQLEKRVRHEDLGIQFHKQYSYSGFRRLWDGWQRTRLFEKRLSKKLHHICPDIIICTTADPVYSIVKVKGKIPLIVESHSICSRTLGEKGFRQRFIAYLLKKGLKEADCLVALTEGDAVEWRKIHSHVEVIPNIVHLNKGPVASLENKRVIWVGRFDYQKCPMEVIKIWQMVYQRFPDWHLDIYGEGELEQELEKIVMSLNMNVNIHQPIERIFDVYCDSSMLVSTSLFEPFGLVLPESMSCGLPVVAFDCPYGPAEIITDGIDGFLIKNRDIHAFAEKVCQLIMDKELRCHFGLKGIASSQRFRADRLMTKWNQLFINALHLSDKR